MGASPLAYFDQIAGLAVGEGSIAGQALSPQEIVLQRACQAYYLVRAGHARELASETLIDVEVVGG